MPRKPTTRVKSEHHAELARRSIADRPRDARGRLLPRTPDAGPPVPASADDVPAGPAAGGQPGASPPAPAVPPADPPRARRRLPWDRRA